MVVNIDISYAGKLLAACVKIVKAQCSATIGISEGHVLQWYMQTSEIINLCIVMLGWVYLLSLSLSFFLMIAIQAKCI